LIYAAGSWRTACGKHRFFGHRHMRQRSVVLEDHANIALVRRQLLDRRITDANFASVGVSKPARIVRGAC
jgi:hypothetical protein